MYKEMITTIGDLKDGDKVLGTDNKWHEIEILPMHKPKTMFELTFTNGKVKCSGDHLWTFYDDFGSDFSLTSDAIYKEKLQQYGFHCGTKDGPLLLNVNKIKPELCRCITLKDSKDMLFQIILDENEKDLNDDKINKTLFEVERG